MRDEGCKSEFDSEDELPMSFSRFLLLACCAMALCGFARKTKLSVRFHVEATSDVGGSFTNPAKFVNPPREGHIETVPFASERDLKAIFPVQNPDGTLGCVFQFDYHGSNGLRTVSTERRGASVVGFISTKHGTHQLLDMPIDKPIVDGQIYIPRGLSPGEITLLKEQYPLIQATKKEKP
jgi:hypothetical protein